MKVVLAARIEFYLSLTALDIETLCMLSNAHYDGRCKASGQIGGFLYGWRNHVEAWELYNLPKKKKKEQTVRASWDDLDTCLKIMEWPTRMLIDKQPARVAAVQNMNKHFLAVMRLANEKYKEWKCTYEPA